MSTLFHYTETTREDLWCGVDVEVYEIFAKAPWKISTSLYVRAHATGNTLIREQRSVGHRVEKKDWKKVSDEYIQEFSAWCIARDTAPRAELTLPWTAQEIGVIRRLQGAQVRESTFIIPLMSMIEEVAAELPLAKSNALYAIGDRLCVLGKPPPEASNRTEE